MREKKNVTAAAAKEKWLHDDRSYMNVWARIERICVFAWMFVCLLVYLLVCLPVHIDGMAMAVKEFKVATIAFSA